MRLRLVSGVFIEAKEYWRVNNFPGILMECEVINVSHRKMIDAHVIRIIILFDDDDVIDPLVGPLAASNISQNLKIDVRTR